MDITRITVMKDVMDVIKTTVISLKLLTSWSTRSSRASEKNSKIKDIITNITFIKDYMDITDIIEETVAKTPQASYVDLVMLDTTGIICKHSYAEHHMHHMWT
jgi:hypothetical protein